MTDRNITRSCKAVQPSKKREYLTTASFIQKAKEVHKDSFDYSKSNFTALHKKLTISCNICGNDFEQTPHNHIRHKQKCPFCFGKKRISTDIFIRKSKLKHGDLYDYAKSKYIDSKTKVVIVCRIHGEFLQQPHNHLNGSGCEKCAREQNWEKVSLNFEKFLERARGKHGFKYTYDAKTFNGRLKRVNIFCKTHGWFSQLAAAHLGGQGCKGCATAKNGHNRTSFISLCERGDGIGSLYLIKCFGNNESFYKVGITSLTIEDRFSTTDRMPYDYEQVIVVQDKAEFIYSLEKRIHSLLVDYRYNPKLSFNGRTECFSYIPKSIIKLLKDLKNTQQLQLIA